MWFIFVFTLINFHEIHLQRISLINIRYIIYFWKGDFLLNMFGSFLFIYLVTFWWWTFCWHIEIFQYNEKYINRKIWSQFLYRYYSYFPFCPWRSPIKVSLKVDIAFKTYSKLCSEVKQTECFKLIPSFLKRGIWRKDMCQVQNQGYFRNLSEFCTCLLFHGYTSKCKLNTEINI